METGDDDDAASATATGLIAALAHAFYGNFPASETIARRFLGFKDRLSVFQLCALCCAAPRLVGELFSSLKGNERARVFLESLESFLRSGDKKRESDVRLAFHRLRDLLGGAFDHAVWMSCEICFEQLLTLSVAKMLPEILHESAVIYIPLLAKAGIKTFLPPQFLALRNSGLITGSDNAVISLPTSTGKTLLSEICIIASVKAIGRMGIFVVPYVALGRQIADRISSHLPDEWKVVRLFGGFKEPGLSSGQDRKLFIVATPERLDALLRYTPNAFSEIDCVVFDEAHVIENGQRGVRMEGLVTRVLLAQGSAGTGRLLFVSAVVPNASEVAAWVGAPPANNISQRWSPSCRRIAVWHSDGRLAWYHSGDPVSPPSAQPDQPLIVINLPWPQRINPYRWNYAEQVIYRDKNYENIAYLCEFMWRREREPLLCVCSTRDTSRQTAVILANRFELLEPIPEEIQKAIDLVATKYPYYTHLQKALRRGIAYHNASLPHDLRAAIEDAARKKELRCVASTTTLAEGIDLPFRTTVVADWVRHKGETQVPYSPLLIRNISGRCGRVGYFTEGDIVIYDNPLGDRKYKAPGYKEEWQEEVFFSKGDPGIESALQKDFGDPAIKATVASQFLAAIAENPKTEQIEARFSSLLFAARSSMKDEILPFINYVTADLLKPDDAFASRNSPLELTELGIAVNRTGFCPASCRRIMEVLRELNDASALEIAFHLLSCLGDLPEQGDSRFTKLVIRDKNNADPKNKKQKGVPKTFVRIEHLSQILAHWLAGMQPIEIFASLPSVLKSKVSPPFEEWVKGLDELTQWDAELDKFCDFLQKTIFEFLPWLLRACSLLDPHVRSGREIEWLEFAELFQRDSAVTQKEDSYNG